VKILYDDLIEYCEINKCKIETTRTDYENQTGRKIISIISSCKHKSGNVRVNDFLIKRKHIICNKCIILKASNRYTEIVNLCISKSCKLITTEEEFNDVIRKDKINIISKCGHPSYNVDICGFKIRDQFVLCKDCQSENKKNFNNNNSQFNSMQIETDSINIIKKNIKNIILEKTVEGCKADIIIKPNNINENLWLPIQIKSSLNKQKTGYYNFMIHKNYYENTIIILVAITDNRIWILDNTLVNGKPTVALGGKESVYNKYEVKVDELDNKIIEFYNNHKSYHITLENANIPVSKSQQLEHIYRLLRKEKINYLTFIEPDTNNITYDFIINNFKVQEKVAIKNKKLAYISAFRKHDGSNDTVIKSKRGLSRKHNYACYKKGDNDFYWINLIDTTFFLIIPEDKLIEKEMINTTNGKETRLYIPEPDNIFNKTHWLKDYIYNYNEDNKERLINIFDL
jgi:hypothetical protein